MSVPWHSPPDPAAITQFELDRVAVLAGEAVLLRWCVENAGTLVVTTPDGMVTELDARAGRGVHRVAVTGTGVVTGTAYGPRGATPTVTRAVAVFEPAGFDRVPLPDFTGTGVRMAPRTPVPGVDRSGVAAALLARGPAGRPTVARAARPDHPRLHDWLTPPAALWGTAPVRPVTAARPPRHLARLFAAGPEQPGPLRRLGDRLRRGVGR